MQSLASADHYRRKAVEAEAHQSLAKSELVKRSWERVILGYLELADMAERRLREFRPWSNPEPQLEKAEELIKQALAAQNSGERERCLALATQWNALAKLAQLDLGEPSEESGEAF